MIVDQKVLYGLSRSDEELVYELIGSFPFHGLNYAQTCPASFRSYPYIAAKDAFKEIQLIPLNSKILKETYEDALVIRFILNLRT